VVAAAVPYLWDGQDLGRMGVNSGCALVSPGCCEAWTPSRDSGVIGPGWGWAIRAWRTFLDDSELQPGLRPETHQ
jgi:hypothetical protein